MQDSEFSPSRRAVYTAAARETRVWFEELRCAGWSTNEATEIVKVTMALIVNEHLS